jgi:hypothetical protein
MTTLFAFQIAPGFDNLLAFCLTLEQAVIEATEHRRELIRGQALDGEDHEVLAPITLYEARLETLTMDVLLPVLNGQQEIQEALVKEKTQVGAVE